MSTRVEIERSNKLYARVIEVFTIAGLALMVIGLVLYLSGAMPAYVSLSDLVKNWGKSASEFWKTVKNEVPTNYDWILYNLGYADIISVLGVMLLPIGVIVGILAVCAAYASRKDVMFAVSIVVLIVMLVALLGPYVGITGGH